MKRLWFMLIFISGKAIATPSLDDYDTFTLPLFLPTTLSLSSSKGQLLTLLGTHHTNNPSDSQYKTVMNSWNNFIKEIEAKKNSQEKMVAVVVESSSNPPYANYPNKVSAIQNDCDRGFASWLSKQKDQVSLVGAELTHQEIIQRLFAEYDSDYVLYFCFAQALLYWSATEKQGDVEAFVMQRVHSWSGKTTVTFNDLVALHKKLTGKSFNPDSSFFERIMNLESHNSLLGSLFSIFSGSHSGFRKKFHHMLKRSHQIRDSHALNIITNEWNQGKNVFVVYGAFHAIALKESLKKLTGQ